MSAEVKLVSLPRKSISASPRSASNGATALAQNSNTLWTGGREYQQEVPNEHEDPRWYRVRVIDLKPPEEITLFYRIVPHDKLLDESFQRYSQYDLLHDDDMIEVAQSETFRFWVVVGGESNKDPFGERSFEVFVQEFAVPVQHALLREVSRTALRWIPRPVLQQVALHVRNRNVWQAPELLARLLPWRRTRPCVIELDNLSPLPVTATFHIDPSDPTAAAGVRSIMRDPLPAGQRHREECRIAITGTETPPVIMRASADVKLTTDRIPQRIIAPEPIEIRRISWLRCWEPYVSGSAAIAVAALLLFGAHPWIEPETTLTVVLHDLPKTTTEKDLNVTLRLAGSDPPLEPRQGAAVKREGDRLTYRFKWGPMLRGFRWDWGKQYDLELVPAPKSGDEAAFAHYRMEPIPIQGHFSAGDNIVLTNMDVPIATMNRAASIVIPSVDPPVPFTYEVLDANGKLISSGQSDRSARVVPVEVLGSDRNVHVNILSQNQLKQSTDVALLPGGRHVIAWSAAADAPSTPVQPAAAVGVVPKPTPAAGGASIPNAAPPTVAGNASAQPPVSGAHPSPAKNKSAPTVVPPTSVAPAHGKPAAAPNSAPGLQLDKVEAWCRQLGNAGNAAALTAGSKEPDALRLTRLSIAKKDGRNYSLVITPSKDCYLQVYELAPPAEPQPVLGIDPDTRLRLPMSYPGAVARPLLARANMPFTVEREAHEPSGAVIVLALRTASEPSDDLVVLLGQASPEPSLKDWTIGYAAYGQK